jgi:hypothetical protein
MSRKFTTKNENANRKKIHQPTTDKGRKEKD